MIRILNASDVPPARLHTPGIARNDEIEKTVAEIVDTVAREGDEALLAYTRKFDGVALDSLEIMPEEWEQGVSQVEPAMMETLRKSAANIADFHRRQLREGFRTEKEDGIVLGQKITPLERVGIYVPGGTAAYPSTVLMNAIPASIAGVKEIIMVSPCRKDGTLLPEVLAAAKIAGVSRVFRVGGAQAIAALAFGTQTVPKVDKIVGPGNVYVATAKRRVFGLVSIDMIAGPSEILILADGKSNPAYVAADLLSQAEHDRQASAILVTDSRELAVQVQAELERLLPLLPRREIAGASIENNGRIFLVDSMEQGVHIANEIAPEHLEICTDDPFAFLPQVKNAGSIFLGRYSPEPLGDYWAGPNHTLPTSGTARFSSPLSVDDFIKKSSYLYYSEEALRKAAPDIAAFAHREGLDAHARAVTARQNPSETEEKS